MKTHTIRLFTLNPNLILFPLITLMLFAILLPRKANAQDMVLNWDEIKLENTLEFVQNTLTVSSPDSAFQMVLPSYLTCTSDLDPDATLQFKNVFSETYLLVYQENLDDDALQGEQIFFARSSFINKLRELGLAEKSTVELDVNGNSALQYEIEMRVEGVDLSYVVTFIESQDKFFKIYFWTLSDQKEHFFPDFKKAVNSFLTVPGIRVN